MPLPAVTLAEVLSTSDVPGGVVNVLTGFTDELVPWLAGHMDVNAIDLSGLPGDGRTESEAAAAGNVKRVIKDVPRDFFADGAQSPYAIAGFLEMKTVWHPKGA